VVAAVAELVVEVAPAAGAILDVGCGTGALLRELGRRLPEDVVLAGIDPAPAMIAAARAGLPPGSRIRLEQGFAERLPFADASFDLVVSTVSFHHWSDRAAGLRETGRVVRAGGRLVLANHFAVGWLRVLNAVARRRMPRLGTVEGMLVSAGFAVSGVVRVFDLGPLPLIRAVLAERV
jgi:ubiquinone/menaquinone biosynthesis C-methylase UbiE